MKEKGFFEIIFVAILLICIVAIFASFILGLDDFHRKEFSESILPEDAGVNTLIEGIELGKEELITENANRLNEEKRSRLRQRQEQLQKESDEDEAAMDERLDILRERLDLETGSL